MEPERTSTHTHIERERRSGSGIAFIVGGLVVAVLVIAYFVFDGGAMLGGGDADTSINVEATSESPTAAAPAEGGAETEAAPAEGGAATETVPPAPAQN